ncbi:galactose-specific lectin nattectin-like [Halichoeres trimaculatus]|uniref:galactose-specific lectin nattectin-like n=1 Tax=Halichoeres trimaculatus TaxID=147232 RepID=UPI003D9ED904
MALVFGLVVALGLWLGADAGCTKRGGCCMACSEGWTELNDSCYMFFHEEKPWDDAEEHCISIGGNLASIHSKADYEALLGLIRRASGRDKPTWIGGYDAVREGYWKWVNGRPFTYRFWGPGHPNNYGQKQDCLEVNYALDKEIPNDLFCERHRSYICGRDLEIREKQ